MADTRKVSRQEYETIKALRKYRGLKYGLKAGTYAACLVPFGVILGVNWQEWFQKTEDGGISIGVGFGMLLVATISTLVAVMKRDEDFMKRFSPLLYVAVLCALWAVSFMFLSSIMDEMGEMLLYTAIGVASGGVIDEVEKAIVEERYQIMLKVAKDNGLNMNGSFERKAIRQAKLDGAAKAKADREAIE